MFFWHVSTVLRSRCIFIYILPPYENTIFLYYGEWNDCLFLSFFTKWDIPIFISPHFSFCFSLSLSLFSLMHFFIYSMIQHISPSCWVFGFPFVFVAGWSGVWRDYRCLWFILLCVCLLFEHTPKQISTHPPPSLCESLLYLFLTLSFVFVFVFVFLFLFFFFCFSLKIYFTYCVLFLWYVSLFHCCFQSSADCFWYSPTSCAGQLLGGSSCFLRLTFLVRVYSHLACIGLVSTPLLSLS